jgi:hypothetical protein
LYINTLFELQLEDGFIKKPKHMADLIIFYYFYIIKVVLDYKFVYTLLIFENTIVGGGMPHLNIVVGQSVKESTSLGHVNSRSGGTT